MLLPVIVAPWVLPERSLFAAAELCRREHPGGRTCPLCGMTRAFTAIARRRPHEAHNRNRAALPLYAALTANEALAAALLICRRRKRNKRIIGVGIP